MNMRRRVIVSIVAATILTTGGSSLAAPGLTDLKNDLSKNSFAKSNAMESVIKLDKKLSEANAEVERLKAEYEKITGEINSLKEEIKKAEEKHEEIKSELSDRIEVMYTSGTADYINLILSSEDMQDLFTKVEMVKELVDYDREKLEELKVQKEKLEEARTKLEEKEKQAKQAKEDSESKKAEIKTAKSEKETLVSQIESEMGVLEAQIGNINRMAEEAANRAKIQQQSVKSESKAEVKVVDTGKKENTNTKAVNTPISEVPQAQSNRAAASNNVTPTAPSTQTVPRASGNTSTIANNNGNTNTTTSNSGSTSTNKNNGSVAANTGASSGGSTSVPKGNGGSVIGTARSFLGVPYVYGGSSPSGFDCSGFTGYVFARHGVSLPRVASSQQGSGVSVSLSALQPGDLVFWGSPAYHVGIYIGGGQYIHAPRTGDVVKISSLSGATSARRVM